MQTVSGPARKLLAVIADQAQRGSLHPKEKGMATPPEILEACGLDVDGFYDLLRELEEAGLIRISNTYPFEEIRLTSEAQNALHDPK